MFITRGKGLVPNGAQASQGSSSNPMILLLLGILHLIDTYTMHYTTRIPMPLVYEVYERSCRISTISSSMALEHRTSVNPTTSYHSMAGADTPGF